MNPEYLNTFFRIPECPESFPGEFVIVTAYNPKGVLSDEKVNFFLDAALAKRLRQEGFFFWRVIGGSRDMKHNEPGYRIETNLAKGIELGVLFRQQAIFHVSGDDLHLVNCSTREQISLGSFRERIIP